MPSAESTTSPAPVQSASPVVVVDAPRRQNTLASAVMLVTLAKILGAALRGPVGAIFGGFIGVLFTSGSIPTTHRFVWIARRNGKEAILGPFFRTDEQAFREESAMRSEGYDLTRLIHLEHQWLVDHRSGRLPS
jgi:hypothetical protein